MSAVRLLAWCAGLAALALAAAGAALVIWLNLRGEAPVLPLTQEPAPAATPAMRARGAYLARIGNCEGCHTAPGGAPYAGGRAIATPFGTVYAGNLTPDAATGLGAWSPSEFRRAMRHGRSRDGRLLVPAFPYANFSGMSPDDIDALYAHLRSLPAVQQAARPHELRFPYGSQAAQAVWRALYFRPSAVPATATLMDDQARGRYLAEAVAHCSACHVARDALGGAHEDRVAEGGVVSSQQWLAPSLHVARQAGVADWPVEDIVALLKTGVSPRGTALGPMAEVVFRSTQYLSDDDARALAVHLRALPPKEAPPSVNAARAAPEVLARGDKLYRQHCADCHGREGQGQPGAFSALAGNRAVTLESPRNLIKMLRQGGFTPVTAGHPRPYGMPPFAGVLDPGDMAAVLSFIRQSWGHKATEVTELDVLRVP